MKKIRLIRKIRDMKQWQLAAKAGLQNYRLCLIETGRAEPRPVELKAIAAALDTTPEVLSDETETASLEALVRNQAAPPDGENSEEVEEE